MPKIKFKKDQYRQSRGGTSKLLKIYCASCSQYLFSYQKDGPGIIKRTYLDRIMEPQFDLGENLNCFKCGKLLGTKMIYEKEVRPAYRIYVGALSRSLVK